MTREQYPLLLEAPLREKWRIEYDQSPLDTPRFSDKSLFVKEPSGHLAAYDKDKETELWVYSEKGWLLDLDERALYFVGENDDTLHIIDPATGRAKDIHHCVMGWQASVFEGLLVTELADCICAIDPYSGNRVWEFATGDDSPVSSGVLGVSGDLFVGFQDGALRALSAEDGTEIWCHSVAELEERRATIPGPATVVGIPWKHKSLVIARVHPDYVVGLAADTGERVWTWRSEFASAPAAGAGCLYGGRLYLTGGGGTYHILDAATGQTILEVRLRDSIPERKSRNAWGWSPLLVSETHAYVGTPDGIVFAFGRDTGQYAWSFSPKDRTAVLRQFVSDTGCLYYRDYMRLYCLEEKAKM